MLAVEVRRGETVILADDATVHGDAISDVVTGGIETFTATGWTGDMSGLLSIRLGASIESISHAEITTTSLFGEEWVAVVCPGRAGSWDTRLRQTNNVAGGALWTGLCHA